MRVKVKLQLIIIPIILIPVLVTAYIFSQNTSEEIRRLHTESLHRDLDIIMNQLDQENSVIERLGAANTRFYERNAQSHARNFIMDLQLDKGKIQIFEHKTASVVGEDDVFAREVYTELYEEIISKGLKNEPVEKAIRINDDNFSVFYQYFEPWDWIVLIYMNENVILEPINRTINQILIFVMALVAVVGVILYILTERLTKPMDDLMEGVKAIGEGDYSKRIVPKTDDEFKDLADAFNDMTTKLQESFNNMNKLTDELMIMNYELEHRVAERTKELKETNQELEYSIIQLRVVQDDLVESRKIAALGALVAGISHELNTPIGIGITTSSYIGLQVDGLLEKYHMGSLKKSDFETELEGIKKSSRLILNNLENASSMVNSFKLLAVDQSREQKKEFELVQNIMGLIQNMNVLIRKGQHMLHFDYEGPIEMYSYPGVISQILTHFIMNSVEHGFGDATEGRINIYVKQEDPYVTLIYEDDGKGVEEEYIQRIFEPFYTSKLGKGSSGLGLNIVYNLVTGILKGKISAMSRPDQGLRFTVIIPVRVKDE